MARISVRNKIQSESLTSADLYGYPRQKNVIRQKKIDPIPLIMDVVTSQLVIIISKLNRLGFKTIRVIDRSRAPIYINADYKVLEQIINIGE